VTSPSGDGAAELEVEATYDGGEGGWSGGTHCAIVDVDAETGIVKVERYVAVEDCGALINPAVVEGQIRGGIAQGIGAVLLERSAYAEDGSLQSATFMDYLMPTACDVPRIEIEHLETVPLDADVNFRGVGEGGMIVAPPTVVNAIEDALSPFGVRIYEQHLPPARILELIAAADHLTANSVLPAQTSPASGSGGGWDRLPWPGVRDRMDNSGGPVRALVNCRARFPGGHLWRGLAAAISGQRARHAEPSRHANESAL